MEPIIGRDPRALGLYLAVRHQGLPLAAAVGRFVAEEIDTNLHANGLADCRLSRFDE